jgi:hypothetical protein
MHITINDKQQDGTFVTVHERESYRLCLPAVGDLVSYPVTTNGTGGVITTASANAKVVDVLHDFTAQYDRVVVFVSTHPDDVLRWPCPTK